ncbi:MAG: CDP-alcohol phosphatidyltransferase family protein, partial [Aquiluna sp.]|nr:CDP-alcohol phosphatidyltransferase family protein [Aquiluna sp.]
MTSRSFLYRQTPNLITSVRILMVPLVLWLIMVGWDSFAERMIALVLLVLAASTDGIDGAIARKRNLVTNLGKILDPIADKALLSGALIVLSIQGAVPWWATVLILIREFGITV